MDKDNPENTVNSHARAVAAGCFVSAETLLKLARNTNVNPNEFVATINKYNDAIEAGDGDEFAQLSLAAGNGDLTPINHAPLYSDPNTDGRPSAFGGVKVYCTTNIPTVNDEAVDGLPDAGEIVGGFHGKGYKSRTSLRKSVTLASIAGCTAERPHFVLMETSNV